MWDRPRLSGLLLLAIILITTLITACSSPGPGARVWIDAPLHETRHPMELIEIIAHASAASGVESFEYFIDGSKVGTYSGNGNRLEVSYFTWEPPGPGVYEIGVRAQDGQGAFGSRVTTTVVIGDVLLYGDRGTEAGYGVCEGVERFYSVADPAVIPPGSCSILFWEVTAPEDWPLLVNNDPVEHVGEIPICLEESSFIPMEITSPMGTCSNWTFIEVGDVLLPTGETLEAPEINFFAERTQISPGQCTMIYWEITPEGEYEVNINEIVVPFKGEHELCLEESMSLLLTAYHPQGPFQSSLTIVVFPEMVSPTLEPTEPLPTSEPPTPEPTSRPTQVPDTTPPEIISPSVSPLDIYTSSCPECDPTTFNFIVRVTDNASKDHDIRVELNWTGDGVRSGPENMYWTGSGYSYFKDLGQFVNSGYLDEFSITATDAAGNSTTMTLDSWHLTVYQCECY